MKVRVTTTVEAPDGATHYSGWLLDDGDPTWWKRQKNSTGVIDAWYAWNPMKKAWMYERDASNPPHWIHELKEDNVV